MTPSAGTNYHALVLPGRWTLSAMAALNRSAKARSLPRSSNLCSSAEVEKLEKTGVTQPSVGNACMGYGRFDASDKTPAQISRRRRDARDERSLGHRRCDSEYGTELFLRAQGLSELLRNLYSSSSAEMWPDHVEPTFTGFTDDPTPAPASSPHPNRGARA